MDGLQTESASHPADGFSSSEFDSSDEDEDAEDKCYPNEVA